MEGNKTSARGPKSAHVIDLRKRGGTAAAVAQPRPGRSLTRKPKALAKPKRLGRALRPKPADEPVLEAAPVAEPAPVAPPTRATAPAAAPAYYDAPTERRFWPAFWRFLLLLVILALIVTAGVYLYLKFYSS